MEEMKADLEAKLRFYKLPKFEHSIFTSLQSDIEKVGEMGRIINNSRGATPPLTIFNPVNFQVYEYSEKT